MKKLFEQRKFGTIFEQNVFFNLLGEVSQTEYSRTIIIQIGKIIGIYKFSRKVRK